MRSIQLIAFSVALFSPALAVPCHEIGIAGEGNGYDDDGRRYNNMVQPPEGITIKPFKYDPFQEDAPFERYDTKDCLVRFQNPNHGALSSITDYVGKLAAARVTDSVWQATTGAVLDTIQKYTGAVDNLKLWLQGGETGAQPYAYAGIFKDMQVTDTTMIQPGLKDPGVVVSYLLPSGVSKVSKVGLDGEDCPEAISNVLCAGIIGIAGTIDPQQDYAYTTVAQVVDGLRAKYSDKNMDKSTTAWPKTPGPYATASKANGDCVVIDFRQMQPFMRFIDGQPDSEMCV